VALMRKKLFFQDLGYGTQMLETLRFFKTGVISKDIFLVFTFTFWRDDNQENIF
jgi:hypothetical protein